MRLPLRDRILLAAGGLAAAASTLRILGFGITLPSAALLTAGSICSVAPLARLLGGGGGSRGARAAIVAVIFGTHLIATLFFFPPEDAINGRPVLTLDHALHYYQVERASEVFAENHRCWTWDPYFMAGYPGGSVFDVDSKGVELWCAVLRPLGTARAYKLFILIGHLLLPFCVYAGSRRMGFRFRESLFGLLVLLAWWHWGRPYAGDFRYAGMFSYLTGMHLSFYLAGLFASMLRGERAWPLYVVGPLAFLVHPTAAVLLPAPLVGLFLLERRRIPAGAEHRRWELRTLGLLAFWCVLVLAANAMSLAQLWRYLDIKVPSQTFFQVAGPVEMARLLLKWGNLTAIGMIALAAAGSAGMIRERRPAGMAPIAGTLFLIIISVFGVYIPLIDQLEPGRFIVPAFVFMTPLAGAGSLMLLRRAGRALRFADGRRLEPAAAVLLLLCAPLFGMLSARAFYRHTISTTFTSEVKEMLDVLIDKTDTSGRLMIEDGPAWNYGDSFLVSMIPLYTGVEQIGGPYPFAFIRHNFSNFAYCRAFDKGIGEFDPGQLREYIDMYNIHWILTASAGCRGQVERSGVAEAVWSSRHFTLWEIPDPSEFSDTPGVRTESAYGTLRVTIGEGALVRTGGSVLLKYHWDRALHVDPPARIFPQQVLDDPVPFIRLAPNGASEMELTVR